MNLRLAARWVAALLVVTAPAGADEAGVFHHYVLALSWNAAWCAAEGDARDADQCDPRHEHGFLVHGLWPQHADGSWPEDCRAAVRDPSRAETGAMADVFGSGGLAWYQWKKHGRCSGLPPRAYFEMVRAASGSVRRPALLREVAAPLRVAPRVIEAAFLEANPALRADGVTVTCRDGAIREVRICLTRDFAPRVCAGRARRDCRGEAVFLPMR